MSWFCVYFVFVCLFDGCLLLFDLFESLFCIYLAWCLCFDCCVFDLLALCVWLVVSDGCLIGCLFGCNWLCNGFCISCWLLAFDLVCDLFELLLTVWVYLLCVGW